MNYRQVINQMVDKKPESFFEREERASDAVFSGEGQLSCDVHQDQDNIYITSMMAGVDQDDLDIAVSNDMVTIRGVRHADDSVSDGDYYVQECYWGSFSRSIVLPQEVDQNKVKADLKNGVLTVTLPKKYKTTSIKIRRVNG